ncbi:MAG: protein kinase [Lachnospiraceae bacterium]|nr:protein kinase [Lachnospiraceae bacterium]
MHLAMEKGDNRLQEPPFALPFDTIINGKYYIEKVLGFGGFGITYQGYNLDNSEAVAIKEYYPSGMVSRTPGSTAVIVNSKSGQFRKEKEKFLQEARIIYSCKNEHLLQIYSLFEENGTAYYAMELLQGRDLMHYIKENGGRISWFELRPYMLQIMDALNTVHVAGVIHRDISPDNIYICSNGFAKLIDFGAARSLDGNKSMSVILKKGYAPPEQYQSKGKQGAWTDVYALGGTMYRAITGVMPVESIERVRKDTLVPPSAYVQDLPPEVDRAIMKALNINERERFQTMEEFRNVIRASDPGIGRISFGDKLKTMFQGFNKPRTDYGYEANPYAGNVLAQNACLIGRSGLYSFQNFPLDRNICIGRDPKSCNIVYPKGTPGISKIHCQIFFEPRGFSLLLIDCGSTCGTYLNDFKLNPGIPNQLKHGDIIRFGADNVFEVSFLV